MREVRQSPKSYFCNAAFTAPEACLCFWVDPGNKVDERLLTVNSAPLVNGPRKHHNDVTRTDLS